MLDKKCQGCGKMNYRSKPAPGPWEYRNGNVYSYFNGELIAQNIDTEPNGKLIEIAPELLRWMGAFVEEFSGPGFDVMQRKKIMDAAKAMLRYVGMEDER